MAYYRKKPVVIEAFQWKYGQTFKCPRWFETAVNDETVFYESPNQLKIRTLEGDHLVADGDYIIKGIAGELYPCKEDIFDKTYEPTLGVYA